MYTACLTIKVTPTSTLVLPILISITTSPNDSIVDSMKVLPVSSSLSTMMLMPESHLRHGKSFIVFLRHCMHIYIQPAVQIKYIIYPTASAAGFALLVLIISCFIFVMIKHKEKTRVQHQEVSSISHGPIYEEINLSDMEQLQDEFNIGAVDSVKASYRKAISLDKNCCYGDVKSMTMTECPAYASTSTTVSACDLRTTHFR